MISIREQIKKLIKETIQMFKEEKLVPIFVQKNTTELLKGKVALITGGSGGIGMAIAETFLKNGCKVIIAGTSIDKLNICINKLRGVMRGNELQSIVIDISDIDALSGKVREAASLFGHIDILVNAAGVNCFTDVLDVSETEYDSVMNVNVKGTYFISQKVARYMIENKIKGHILNITSSSALRPAKTPYHLSKWTIRGFTLGLADKLLSKGIVVNAIAPGPVATSMLGKSEGETIYKEGQPLGRYAMPTEIANMAVILVSDIGNLVVGDTLYMTGGSGVISLHN